MDVIHRGFGCPLMCLLATVQALQMASFARSPAPRAEWKIAEAALFAARKEYELRLLSADKSRQEGPGDG
eukprot:5120629-Prymnesium_polylepis.1